MSVGLAGQARRARVWLKGAGRREEIEIGADGQGRVRGLSPGPWRLNVARGRARREQGVELSCGHNIYRGVMVPRPSALWGRVLSGGGKPLPRARIELRHRRGLWEARALSAGDGSFVFEGLAAGPALLRVKAPGRRTITRAVELPAEVQLRMLPARLVRGVVRGMGGEEVEVLLVGPASRRRTRAASSGHFEFDGLLPGSYEVFAVTLKAPWRATPLAVTRAGQSPLEMRLQPATRLRGRVIGEGGKPLAARVVLRPTRPVLFSAEVEADAQGRFVAPALPVGRYRLEAWAAGWLPSLGRTVDLSRQGEPITLRLGRGHRIAGSVVDEQGHAVRGALLRLFPGADSLGAKVGELGVVPGPVPPIPPPGAPLSTRAAASRLWSASTGPKGQFVVEGIPSGKARYTVLHPDYDQAEGLVAIPRAAPLALRLRRGTGVAGSVRDWRTGAPISRFSIAVDGKGAKSFREARGAFLLKLDPGKRRLQVRAPGYARRERIVEVGARGARRESLLFELVAAGSIEGTIRDALGRPVSGARLRAAGASARSDSRGRFVIKEVPEGSHVVVLTVEGETERSDPISVRAGERSGPVRFHLTTPTPE